MKDGCFFIWMPQCPYSLELWNITSSKWSVSWVAGLWHFDGSIRLIVNKLIDPIKATVTDVRKALIIYQNLCSNRLSKQPNLIQQLLTVFTLERGTITHIIVPPPPPLSQYPEKTRQRIRTKSPPTNHGDTGRLCKMLYLLQDVKINVPHISCHSSFSNVNAKSHNNKLHPLTILTLINTELVWPAACYKQYLALYFSLCGDDRKSLVWKLAKIVTASLHQTIWVYAKQSHRLLHVSQLHMLYPYTHSPLDGLAILGIFP